MMDPLDLKKLEQKAFRAMHQDGLWDIYIGGVALSMSFLAYSNDSEEIPTLQFILFFVGLAAAYLVFWAGKKYLVTPRLGQVKFSPRRQKRKATLALILTGVVVLQLIVLFGTIFLWSNPQWMANMGLSNTDQERERLLVALIGSLFVGPSTALIAYFNDFTRGYYIALVLSLAVFSLIWFSQPIYLILAALLILIPGVFIFVSFLRQHPLPPIGAGHD